MVMLNIRVLAIVLLTTTAVGCTIDPLPPRPAPDVVPPGIRYSQVSAGGNHTCGVKTDGTVACWGSNNEFASDKVVGQAEPPGGTFTSVSAGDCYTCGVKTDGTVACWGENDYGQATPPTGIFISVSAGGAHACGVKTDGTVACWGYNY
jgi:alpha-tubulin suppressor-like RCC1 family protein